MDKGVQSLTKSSGLLVSRGAGKLTERVSPFRRNGRTQQRRKVSLKELSYQLSQRERRCPLPSCQYRWSGRCQGDGSSHPEEMDRAAQKSQGLRPPSA